MSIKSIIRVGLSRVLNRLLPNRKLIKSRLMKILGVSVFDGQYGTIIKLQEKHLSKYAQQSSDIAFTLVLPVTYSNLESIQVTVQSVFGQNYLNWALLIVVSDELSAIKEDIRKFSTHPKVKLIDSGQVSEYFKGELFILLTQGGSLHPCALATLSFYKTQSPEACVLYTDEDMIEGDNQRVSPHFKSDWNPDLLYSCDYLSGLTCFHRDFLGDVKNVQWNIAEQSNYSILLDRLKREAVTSIIRIPYVLFHRHSQFLEKINAFENKQKMAKKEALMSHLSSLGVVVSDGMLANTNKVSWLVPSPAPLASIIIPTKNSKGLVKLCIESIQRYTDKSSYEILLVDNGSDDMEALSYFQELESNQVVRLLQYNKPFNFSAINNYAVTQAKGQVLVLMNNDIEVQNESWLPEMVSNVMRKDIGCVGVKLFYPDGRIQHAGVIGGLGGVAGHSHKYFQKEDDGYFKRLKVVQNMIAVTGACLAVRKSLYQEVGGMNEENLSVAFNDIDFCLKIFKAGYRNVWTPYVQMVHHESVSRGSEDTWEKQVRFASEIRYMKSQWANELFNDPYYNPWLTKAYEDFSYR